MSAYGVQGGNGVVENKGFAAAGRAGQDAGPFDPFNSFAKMGYYFVQNCVNHGRREGGRGPWRNAQDRFLGVKFVIDGELHYGWVRLNVDGSFKKGLLTGYAYETIPNKPIEAFDGDPNPVPTVFQNLLPGSLGQLAAGYSGRTP